MVRSTSAAGSQKPLMANKTGRRPLLDDTRDGIGTVPAPATMPMLAVAAASALIGLG